MTGRDTLRVIQSSLAAQILERIPVAMRKNFTRRVMADVRRTGYTPHQGHSECERRVRQLASGFIKQVAG